MKAMKVEKIYDALVEFCVKQSNGKVGIERINAVVEDAIDTINECPNPRLSSETIMSYDVFVGGKKEDNLLYNDMYDNSVICEDGIRLGRFMMLDESFVEHGDTAMYTEYDIIYDPSIDEIILLYTVVTDTASDVMSFYRVQADLFEDFSLEGFVYSLTAQICTRLIKAYERKRKGE